MNISQLKIGDRVKIYDGYAEGVLEEHGRVAGTWIVRRKLCLTTGGITDYPAPVNDFAISHVQVGDEWEEVTE